MMNKEQQLRLLQHFRWLLVVLCFCCGCTAKHGTAIAFTNAAIAATRGGAANTGTPTTPTAYTSTTTQRNPTDHHHHHSTSEEIRYSNIVSQHAAVTSEAPSSTSQMNGDHVSSSHNHVDGPSQVRTHTHCYHYSIESVLLYSRILTHFVSFEF